MYLILNSFLPVFLLQVLKLVHDFLVVVVELCVLIAIRLLLLGTLDPQTVQHILQSEERQIY